MKCREIKYFLLGSENPDLPPADIQAHLAVCTTCQEWQNRLVQIEMNLPFLPVPQTAARNALLRRILAQPPVVEIGERQGRSAGARVEAAGSLVPRLSLGTGADRTGSAGSQAELGNQGLVPTIPIAVNQNRPSRVRAALSAIRSMEPGLRRFAGGSVAAAILLGVLGWLVLRGPHNPPPVAQRVRPAQDPLLASILQRDLRLAEAENARERVLALADLAEDLSKEVKALAPKAEAKDLLVVLVNDFRNVVANGLVPVAKDINGDGRNDTLNAVGDRLHRAGREAEELAMINNLPDSSKKPLQELGRIAKKADAQLRNLRTEAANPNDMPRNSAATAVAVRKERP